MELDLSFFGQQTGFTVTMLTNSTFIFIFISCRYSSINPLAVWWQVRLQRGKKKEEEMEVFLIVLSSSCSPVYRPIENYFLLFLSLPPKMDKNLSISLIVPGTENVLSLPTTFLLVTPSEQVQDDNSYCRL